MLHLNTASPHHESGHKQVTKDANMVLKVMAAMDTNPFTATMPALINIATDQCADPEVKDHLLDVKEVGHKALSDSISGGQEKTTIVRLKTFTPRTLNPRSPSRSALLQAGVMKLLPFFG